MIMVALLFVGGVQVYGQSFKDLLNKGKDVVGPVVEQLDVIPKNIEGNWSSPVLRSSSQATTC